MSGFSPFFGYAYDMVADYVLDPQSTQFLSKWDENYVSQGLFRVTPIRDKAHELLGIEDSVISSTERFPFGANLFAGQNSLETIEALVLEIFGPRD